MSERFTVRNTATETDIDTMHHYLSIDSYWAKGVPRSIVSISVTNSLPFLVDDAETGTLIAFARVITDRATFAYLGDVYVLAEYRGQGVSKFLMETILAHPDLQKLRRFLLFTRDAHGLYEQFGFTTVPNPEAIMQRHTPNPYSK